VSTPEALPGKSAQGVAILGATGSIGQSALNVMRRHRDRYRVVALTAHASADAFADLVAEWNPAYRGLVTASLARDGWCTGPECLVEAASHPDAAIVLNAVVGAAGLPATLAALRAGKRVALADPEDAHRITGCVRGGTSVFGSRSPKRLPVLLDDSALEHATIVVNGGRRGLQLELFPHDLLRATGGRTLPLT
jgi:1-deoxy-D-xylulose 5-phosphate reductoisomerase